MVAATSFQPILEQGYQVITLWVKADLSAFSCVFFRSEDDLVIEWLLESQHFARSMKSQLCWKRFFRAMFGAIVTKQQQSFFRIMRS